MVCSGGKSAKIQVSYIFAQVGLVVFDDQQVACVFVFDQVTGRFMLSVHRIGGDNRTLQGDGFEQCRQFGDFVGFLFDGHLADMLCIKACITKNGWKSQCYFLCL